jgi:hypothetical protein
MSEIPRKPNSFDEAILGRIGAQEWPGVVFAAIVNEYHLNGAGVLGSELVKSTSQLW